MRRSLFLFSIFLVLSACCSHRKEQVQFDLLDLARNDREREVITQVKASLTSSFKQLIIPLLQNPVVHLKINTDLRTYSSKSAGETKDNSVVYFGKMKIVIPAEMVVSTNTSFLPLKYIKVDNEWGLSIFMHTSENIVKDLQKEMDDVCTGCQEDLRTLVKERRMEISEALIEDFRKRFRFSSDYELYRRMMYDDFSNISLDRLSINELIELYFLLKVKLLVSPRGAEDRILEVRTPYFKGFEFGTIAEPGPVIFELSDAKSHLNVFFLSSKDIAVPEKFKEELVASIQYHDSKAPGKDMFNAASKVLQSKGQKSLKLAALYLASALQYEPRNSLFINEYESVITKLEMDETSRKIALEQIENLRQEKE